MKKLSLALAALLVVSAVKAEGEEGFFANVITYATSVKDTVVNTTVTAGKFLTESYKAHITPVITSVASVIANTPVKQSVLVGTSALATLGGVYLASQKIKNNTYKLAFVGTTSALVLAAAGYLGYNIYSGSAK